MYSGLEKKPVARAYKHLLALHAFFPIVIIMAGLVAAYLWLPGLSDQVPSVGLYFSLGGLLALWLVLALVWAPRRHQVTHYYVAEDFIGYVVGAVWHSEVVVTFNRLQHLEIAQGPIERALGVSRLVLYTAGGGMADLVIPGLPVATAETLRDAVLNILREETLSDEPITEAKRHDNA
ncbi:hypothetical protein CWE15_08675 [Aliidiomarina taiwanensis]|uniref:YdbS-like PH domain-containing protein n=1 Tax=Aliidiomarina taiwanensis TaxID=946228 RepID=A0A432X0Z8_9GAMM|nr:PH domain-containing protein [Aliidiomarina taiwanensis]RUO39822.1 hypothetical protein CWE15_08675 [Aliidiomarina taiwanensis]